MPARMVEFTLTSTDVRDTGYADIGFPSANAYITVVGGNIRYSYAPGQAPTPNSGHRGFPGPGLLFKDPTDITNLLMVAENNDVQVTITHKAS